MSSTATILLAPLGALYSAATRARLSLYRAGALKVYDLGAPTISVGNITAGGTGKTPMVEWVARVLADEGLRVCILTRGYARADVRKRVVVSDSERVLASAREGGDEPRMLAEKLKGKAAVISDRDRVDAGLWAKENFHSDAFILDDGFQHLRVARNLNIVIVDATNPWGGGKLLPRGRLREPKRGLARADCVIITRADQTSNLDALREEIKILSGSKPDFISRTETAGLKTLLDEEDESDASAAAVAQPVGAFCAIGNPRQFFSQIEVEGYQLAFTRSFPDHHFYSQRDIDALVNEARSSGALSLITTAKDAVKLNELSFDLPCFVLEIEMRFEDEDGILKMILRAMMKSK
ncbi:MAG: tetraacyldisaccharide 4'-kinase [Acidobacteria bacterium 13_1_20CM_3_53_8]|nr:MAG: tetraacyldisaccharide 4'-kinase [Acidobacteria bacterium 13_1_20CM_3_53_8]